MFRSRREQERVWPEVSATELLQNSIAGPASDARQMGSVGVCFEQSLVVRQEYEISRFSVSEYGLAVQPVA